MGMLLNSMLSSVAWTQTKRVAFPATTYANVQVRLVLTSSNFDYSKANSDGSDLRFTASSADSPSNQYLDYWIESWVQNGTSVVWFKVPTANTSQVWMWFGNSLATSAEKSLTSFMERGFRWESFTGTALATPKFGGNDTNLNQGDASSLAVAGQTIGTTTISARWEGWLLPEEPGEYTFGWTDDDGGRAWIDGVQVYNVWADAGMTEYKYAVTVGNSKPKPYKYEWYNSGGNGGYRQGVGARTGRRVNLISNPSFEVDLATWQTGGSNVALDTTRSFVGTTSAKMTRAGATVLLQSDPIPCVSGQTYNWAVYMYLTSTVSNLYIDMMFLNEAGGVVSDGSNTNPTYATQNSWQKVQANYTAPVGAVSMQARVVWDGGVNGEAWVDACMLEAASTTGSYVDGSYTQMGWYGTPHASQSWFDSASRVNAVRNPRAAVNTNSIYGATAANDVTRRTDDGVAGSTCFETTLNAVGRPGVITWITHTPTMPGDPWTGSAYIKSLNSTVNFVARLQFYAADGSTQLQNTAGTAVALSTSWQRVSFSATAPAGAAYVRLLIQASAADAAAGTAVRVTGIMLERTNTLGAFFDGSAAPAVWRGTEHDSWSLLYPTDRANLLLNPAPASADGWLARFPDDNTVSYVASGGALGGGYLKVAKVTSANNGASFWPAESQWTPVTPGESVAISFYCKSPNSTATNQALIMWYAADKTTWLSTVNASAVAMTTSWQRYSHAAVAPANAAYAVFRSGMANTTAQFEVHYSNMQVEKAAAATAYTDGTVAGSSWTGTAHASPSVRRTGSTTVTYPFPLSWVWGPKFDPAFPGSITAQTAVVGDAPTGLDSTLPQDVGLWLDMSDESVFTKDGSNNVTAIADKSGLGRSFTRGSASGVTYVSSARNSKSSCRLNGSGYLQHTAQAAQLGSLSQTAIVAALSSDAADKDIVWYYKTGSTAQEASTVYDGGGANGTNTTGAIEAHFGFDASNNPEIAWGDSGSGVAALIQFANRTNATNPKVFGWRIKPGSNPQIVLNSAADPSAGTFTTMPSNRAPTPPTFVLIGAHGSTSSTTARWLNGDVYEVLVWNRYLTDQEITAVTNYLYVKWDIST